MTVPAPQSLVVGHDGSEPARSAVMYAADRVGPGTDYELVLVPGSAAEALVITARRHEADEIVLGSRGMGRLGSVLGSVAQQVLHTADRPVVVIPYLAVREKAIGLS